MDYVHVSVGHIINSRSVCDPDVEDKAGRIKGGGSGCTNGP